MEAMLDSAAFPRKCDRLERQPLQVTESEIDFMDILQTVAQEAEAGAALTPHPHRHDVTLPCDFAKPCQAPFLPVDATLRWSVRFGQPAAPCDSSGTLLLHAQPHAASPAPATLLALAAATGRLNSSPAAASCASDLLTRLDVGLGSGPRFGLNPGLNDELDQMWEAAGRPPQVPFTCQPTTSTARHQHNPQQQQQQQQQLLLQSRLLDPRSAPYPQLLLGLQSTGSEGSSSCNPPSPAPAPPGLMGQPQGVNWSLSRAASAPATAVRVGPGGLETSRMALLARQLLEQQQQQPLLQLLQPEQQQQLLQPHQQQLLRNVELMSLPSAHLMDPMVGMGLLPLPPPLTSWPSAGGRMLSLLNSLAPPSPMPLQPAEQTPPPLQLQQQRSTEAAGYRYVPYVALQQHHDRHAYSSPQGAKNWSQQQHHHHHPARAGEQQQHHPARAGEQQQQQIPATGSCQIPAFDLQRRNPPDPSTAAAATTAATDIQPPNRPTTPPTNQPQPYRVLTYPPATTKAAVLAAVVGLGIMPVGGPTDALSYDSGQLPDVRQGPGGPRVMAGGSSGRLVACQGTQQQHVQKQHVQKQHVQMQHVQEQHGQKQYSRKEQQQQLVSSGRLAADDDGEEEYDPEEDPDATLGSRPGKASARTRVTHGSSAPRYRDRRRERREALERRVKEQSKVIQALQIRLSVLQQEVEEAALATGPSAAADDDNDGSGCCTGTACTAHHAPPTSQ